MYRIVWITALALLIGCEPPTAGTAIAGSDRELGTVEAIYPYYSPEGEWLLEYQMTLDTVFVDFAAARSLAQDTAWKKALTRSSDVFYDNGQACMYARSVAGCLPFLRDPAHEPLPAP